MKLNSLTLIFFIVLSSCFQSCKNYDKNSQTEQILNFVKKKNKDLNLFSCILIIPGSGCGGCISQATHFLISKDLKFEKTLIIFTAIENYKNLKIITGNKINKSYIVIDSLNQVYNRLDETSIYPKILVKNDKTWFTKIFEDKDSLNLR